MVGGYTEDLKKTTKLSKFGDWLSSCTLLIIPTYARLPLPQVKPFLILSCIIACLPYLAMVQCSFESIQSIVMFTASSKLKGSEQKATTKALGALFPQVYAIMYNFI